MKNGVRLAARALTFSPVALGESLRPRIGFFIGSVLRFQAIPATPHLTESAPNVTPIIVEFKAVFTWLLVSFKVLVHRISLGAQLGLETEPTGDPQQARQPAERLKVFISYSRTDARFASEVTAGLEYDGGFDVLIDRHSIHEGEEWKARLRTLLAEADTVVVILSPHWLSSLTCSWELEEAFQNSKRVVPVLAASLEGRAPPPRLAAINYVRFDHDPGEPPRLFMEGMAALRRALNTDLSWVREHTRLLGRAQEWAAAGRVVNRMLAGSDIVAAKEWMARQPRVSPVSAYGTDLRLCIKEDLGFVVVTKERK
jgi:hypothetical protein